MSEAAEPVDIDDLQDAASNLRALGFPDLADRLEDAADVARELDADE